MLHQPHGWDQVSSTLTAGVCIPTILTNRQVSAEDTPGEGNSGPHSAGLVLPDMVSLAVRDVDTLPSPFTESHDSSTRPIQQGPPSSSQGTTTASRLESIQHAHTLSGVSERASAIISAGWRKGTNSAYQLGWLKGAGWCDKRCPDPLSCDVQHFLDLLTELFDDGLQHRTINMIHSAVSVTRERVEGMPIGQHPLVSRLMKGVDNLRPPTPRYTYTWDVERVIQCMAAMGESTKLPWKKLSQKLAFLMPLVTAS